MRIGLKTCIVLCLLAIGGSVYGQGHQGTALTSALDRTDEIIDRAREAVAESGSQRAENLLRAAIQMQERAHGQATDAIANGNATMALRAGKLTLDARQRAEKAIAITRQGDENDDFLRRKLENTDNMIRRVEEKIAPDTPENILLMLDSAKEKQFRATELYRNRRLKMSLQLTLQVQKSLELLVDRVGGHIKSQHRYNSLLDRYYLMLDKIELSDFSTVPDVETQLERAENLKAESENHAAKNRFAQAERSMQNANEILSRITERLKEPGRIRSALEIMKQRAERIQNEVAESNNNQLQNQYRTCLEHLGKATAMYQEKQYDGAVTQLQAARQILSHIENIIK